MATYVVGDIHNSLIKLNGVLKQISLSYKDNLILLGDLFDRGAAEPDPVGCISVFVYWMLELHGSEAITTNYWQIIYTSIMGCLRRKKGACDHIGITLLI